MGLFRWILRLLGIGAPRTGTAAASDAPVETAANRPTQERPVVPALEHLDPGRFAPLGDAELRQQLAGAARTAWLGRRDRIPPVTDRRTELIDRAMVGHGFITSEELAEIHRVGAAMDAVRPDPLLAAEQARAAVAQSESERQERKRRKQAEAAERRRRHAEAVAHRRQTDIVFLGRGVSKGLAERQSDVARLNERQLPVLATPADVAAALDISIPRLRWLAFHTPAATRTHYLRFTVPKKSGGTRELAAPHRDLARYQEWILQNVLNRLPAHDAAHGFIIGRNTRSGAQVHVGAEVVVNCDVREFFPSITFPRVQGLFRQWGYSPAVATIFALLCTECPRRTVEYAGQRLHVATGERALPQGACTSPALSNLLVRRLDARLNGITRRLGWQYTRYADDLTFSASGESAQRIGYLLARVRHIVADEGFQLNEEKTRVQRRHTAQTVTGIVVNQRPGVPRKVVRRLRSILHHARTEGLAAQNRDGHPNFAAWVEGMLAYIHMVNPRQAEPLREAWAALSEPRP